MTMPIFKTTVFSAAAAILLALGTSSSSAFVPAEGLTSASAAGTVDLSRIRQLLADREPGGIVGLHVVDGATNTVLFSLNEAEPLKPASCNKLLTTAAGLSLLGPDYRFVTSIYARGTVNNGTLQGDLIVRGGGDPTISARFESDKRDTTAIFRRWADALTSAGIRRISGDIVADDSFFDSEYYHPAWPGSERGEWYSAEVSALAFNDNCIDISWSSRNKVPGDLAGFRLNPVTNYVQINNNVRVLAKGRPTERYYERPAVLNDLLCTGSLTVDVSKDDSAAVHDGALFAVTVLRDVLTSQGISVGGRARKDNTALTSGPPSTMLFEHRSPPLSEVVNVINRNSQNFYAECLLKTLGKVIRNEGSFSAGAAVVQDFVTSAGIFSQGHQMVDGSGLSHRNRVSPRQLVELIRYMDQSPVREAWRDSLPIGQTRGSLRTRFNATTESLALAPRIFGKTGTISRVRSLSGMIDLPGRAPLYYSIMLNGYQVREAQALALIDDLAVTLARN